jgi:RNA polymerase sigma factor (sigma-70 family)
MIIANYGTAEDARILFQEAVLIFIKEGQNPDFKLPVPPKIYLYALCRNLWLEKLEAQKIPDWNGTINDPDKSIALFEINKKTTQKSIDSKYALLSETIEKLGPEGKELLISFYYKKMSIKDIAERMNCTTAVAKIKKKRFMDAVKNQFFDVEM